MALHRVHGLYVSSVIFLSLFAVTVSQCTMLNSIDLFSGLGGIAHSLRGFVEPLVYCDIEPVCRATIEARIATGDLADAPIVRDVRDTRAILAAVGSRKVDMLISSSSCVGFSTTGARAGLRHPETKLFLDVLDLLVLVKAPMLFMENVGAILTSNDGRDYKAILSRFASMGYRVSWCVLTAEHVGGWHKRRRWFALAYKPLALRGQVLRLPISLTVHRFKWTQSAKPVETVPPPRKSCEGSKEMVADSNRRMKMLGNAVVPDCTRLAFMYLYSGGAVSDITTRRMRHEQFDAVHSVFSVRNTFPTFGISSARGGIAHEHVLGPLPYKPVKLSLKIDLGRHTRTRSKHVKSLKGTVIMDRYMTPRAQNLSWCHFPTHRCLGDLGTQLRFMRGVPNFQGHINPRFVEFLMGYPRDWTSMRLSVSHNRAAIKD